ncbi:MAG: hypothetical protein WC634_04735 [archaeon]
MPLSHFVVEAKKHTPVFVPKPAQTVTMEPMAVEEADLEPRSELKKKMAIMSEAEKAVTEQETVAPEWKTCQYLKPVGQKTMCSQYLSLCAQEKCQKRFMEASFFDFKKYLKSGKPIK